MNSTKTNKKILLITAFFICCFLFLGGFAGTAKGICEDSDGGMNYYEKGLTGISGFPPYVDRCYIRLTEDENNYFASNQGPFVGEWYCDDSGNPQIENGYECAGGCVDGACVEVEDNGQWQ